MLLSLLLVLGWVLTVTADTECDYTLDVQDRWGVTYQGLSLALEEVRALFSLEEDLIVCLYLAPGIHRLHLPGPDSSLDLSGSWGVARGRLVIHGAGIEETVLEVDPHHTLLKGYDVKRVTIRDLQFRRTQELTSQGTVQKVGHGFVTLHISAEFPGLDIIYDNTSSSGRYLRKYQSVDGDCEIVEEENQQVPWRDYQHVGEGMWKVFLNQENRVLDYQVGQLVGVKSKCCGNGHNAYFFCGGDDLVFERVSWTHHSRGVIRCGISNVRFSSISIRRGSPAWCLATSGGGPQIGQPNDVPIHNVTVENLIAENTGDGSIPLFDVASGGVIRNCQIKDSFARGILLYNSRDTSLVNNTVVRCPVLYNDAIETDNTIQP